MPDPDYSAYDTLAPADQLAAYLRTVTGLSGVPVIVARQKDLTTEIDTAVAKSRGAAILIALEDWDETIADSSLAYIELGHSISIWTTPLLRKTAIPESIVLGLLIAAIHRYCPDPDDTCRHWTTAGGVYVKHDKHRVYKFSASIELVFPAVAINAPTP